MSEIDDPSGRADATVSGHDPDSIDEAPPSHGEEPDLDLIGRLAEEDTRADTPLRSTGSGGDTTFDAPAILGAIKALGDQLVPRLDSLQTAFERELRAETTRERVVDRLHAELQEYKQDFLLKVQRPIFIDLIQLHDDIGKMIDARALADQAGERSPNVRELLEPIQIAIEDILYRQGVEPFTLTGTEFDPRKQRAISTQPTEDLALNKRVASRLRKGFCSGDKLIRPEIVTVFTFVPSAVDVSERQGSSV